MPRRGLRAALVAAALATCPITARATSPEWNVGALTGVAGVGHGSEVWSGTRFLGAVHGDLLFGRTAPAELALGPAMEMGTAGFSDLRLSGGATVLLPLGDLLALGVTPAVSLHLDEGRTAPGISARGFFGARVLNYGGSYTMAGGLVGGFDRDLDAQGANAVVIAAQVDGLLLALPVVILVEWLRGPRD